MPSSYISTSGLLFLFQTTGGPISLKDEEMETHSSSSLMFPGIFIKQSHDKTDDIITNILRPMKPPNDYSD